MRRLLHSLTLILVLAQCTRPFPSALVDFTPYPANPVFSGTDTSTWDRQIRERGYILKEDGVYHLWYTGYGRDINEEKHLGYATSPDGMTWTRYKDNPIYDSLWVEDMIVLKSDGIYYMFAEGKNDIAHLLTSTDRIHWKESGPLDIRRVDGTPVSRGAYGTPAVWLEQGTWYLFYERDDSAVWLATSKDRKVWTNLQDDPVLKRGPEAYDQYAVAMDQIIRYEGRYYGYYHATAFKDWSVWSSCIATSDDLIHWTKYFKNPILSDDKSSPIVVPEGEGYRLYTMHPAVNVYLPTNR